MTEPRYIVTFLPRHDGATGYEKPATREEVVDLIATHMDAPGLMISRIDAGEEVVVHGRRIRRVGDE